MCAAAPDRLEHRRAMPRCRPDQLLLFGNVQPLHRAADAAPAVPEDLARDGIDGVIQRHERTPSRPLWLPVAWRRDGGARAGRSRPPSPRRTAPGRATGQAADR